jgi:16S rRNA (cytosine1402-N4)-methyltransferase
MEAVLGETSPHLPVLYHEIIHALRPREGGFYVDCTLGAGGHAAGILQASSPDGSLLGLDVDPNAIALAGQRLADFGSRVVIRKASYRTLREQLDTLGWPPVEGILLDLGA